MSTTLTQIQPDVYPFAAFLGQHFGCTHMIAVGERTVENLAQFHPQFEIVGVVKGANPAAYRSHYEFVRYVEGSFERPCEVSVDEDILKRAIIVCTDMLERLASPAYLLENLKDWLDCASICIVTCADMDLMSDAGSQEDSAYPRARWSRKELERVLRSEGFNLEFIGLTASDTLAYEKKTVLAVITNNRDGRWQEIKAPPDFRVVAFMAAYNEEDIIVQSIKDWTEQGVFVHVLENWSTDATYDLAKQLEGRLPVTVERFPAEGPSQYFNWEATLNRIEELSREIQADWFVRRGADEILKSPWPGVGYRDGLYMVEQAGFNCVDHTVIEFQPVDEGFAACMNHEDYFKYFDFGQHPAHFSQRKTWKNFGQEISMRPSGGHDLPFEGRRVFPFKFLLKHYPVRSQKHGEKKVFQERKARWNPEERARGWHAHYDHIGEGYSFLHSSSDEKFFDEDSFNRNYLVERLSGIGALRK